MGKFDYVFLCVSLLLVLSSFSISFAHKKPPPFDPHNCSCINQNGQTSSSGGKMSYVSSSSSQGSQSSSSTSSSSSQQTQQGSTYFGQTNTQIQGKTTSGGQTSNQSNSSTSSGQATDQSKASNQQTQQGSSSSGQTNSQNQGKTTSSEQASNQSNTSTSSGLATDQSNTSNQQTQQGSTSSSQTNTQSQGKTTSGGQASDQSNTSTSGEQATDQSNTSTSSGQTSNQSNTSTSSGQATDQSNTSTSGGQATDQSNTHISSGQAIDQSNTSDSGQGANQSNTSRGQSNNYAGGQGTDQSNTSSEQSNTSSGGQGTSQSNTSGEQSNASGGGQGTDQSNTSGGGQDTDQSNTSGGQQTQTNSSASLGSGGDFKGIFTKVYAFGDSFTDTGNAEIASGLKAFVAKIFSQAFYGSSTNLPGHRLCNGKLLIDFLCDHLGLPAIQAYKEASADFSSGVNFAIAGTTSLSFDLFKTFRITQSLFWKANPINCLSQIDWFNQFLLGMDCKGKDEAQCKGLLGNSLFWIGAIGISDYARIIGSVISGKTLQEASVDHVCKILKTLLDRGGKYVIVQGLPPVGCCPLQLILNPPKDRDNMGCAAGINALIMAHNELLQKRLTEFQAQYKDAVIVYADTWKAYRTILTNYKKYNFEEPFKACCGAGGGLLNVDLQSLCGSTGTTACQDPQKYISWDGIHLTESMNQNLAQLFFKEQGYLNPSFDAMIQAKAKLQGGVKPGIGVGA